MPTPYRVMHQRACKACVYDTYHSISPFVSCRANVTLADFDVEGRIGDGSFSEVLQVLLSCPGAAVVCDAAEKPACGKVSPPQAASFVRLPALPSTSKRHESCNLSLVPR